MPKSKSSVKGSRKISKVKKNENSKKTSKKTSKKSSKKGSRKTYKNVTSSSEEMRQLLSSTEEKQHSQTYVNQPMMNQQMMHQPMMNQQMMNQQMMNQPQIMSPSQVDPMLVNSFVPYQQNQQFMNMNPNSLMSSQQMVQGLQNFAGMNDQYNNNILSPTFNQSNVASTPNFTSTVVNSPVLANTEMPALQGPMMQGNVSAQVPIPINDAAMQGMPMQGMQMQGMSMQGMPMQGMPMQGMPMQSGGSLNIMNIKNFI